jgi:hypothetical protein
MPRFVVGDTAAIARAAPEVRVAQRTRRGAASAGTRDAQATLAIHSVKQSRPSHHAISGTDEGAV